MNKYLIIVYVSLFSFSAYTQDRLVELNFGANYNPTLKIHPDIYGTDNTMYVGPILNLNFGIEVHDFLIISGLGYHKIGNIFELDENPLISESSEYSKPRLSVYCTSLGVKIEKDFVRFKRHRFAARIGISAIYYFAERVWNNPLPSGSFSISNPQGMDPIVVNYQYDNFRRESTTWGINPEFTINYHYRLTENLFFGLSLGGSLSIYEALQTRVNYQLRSDGIDVEGYLDLKNTGSFLLSTIGIRYLL